VNIPVPMPLDNDGFLRRECPNCEHQFKWHSGPANEAAETQPSPDSYFCPFCGEAAATDQWWTTEQVEYARAAAMPAALRSLDDELSSAIRKLKSKHIRVKKTGHLDIPNAPDPLAEPDDMMIIASPCHAWEPVKVPEDTTSPLHCLICGQVFAL
jgi:Zn ribbon nucleic-acid-binding protein